MSLSTEDFKEVLRRWASGVTVVTARHGDHMHGMTVSAFSSVSADPPLVLVCANQESTTHGVIKEGGIFTVNILASDQEKVSSVFSSSQKEDVRFTEVEWTEGVSGAPLIKSALANIECNVIDAYPAGSHTIFIGQVLHMQVRDAEPLLYYSGGYRQLGS